MSADVIGAIRDKILPKMAADAAPTIIWHAGEPTVVPVDWYRHAYTQLRRTAPREATFSIQTNGVSLSREWFIFLQETQTHIGLSIDGPQQFHDSQRKTKNRKGTWALAVRTLRNLQDAGIEPSVVTVLHPRSLSAADEYFEFYQDHAITHVSFSIDEAEGAHATSSFAHGDHGDSMTSFVFTLLRRAFTERYPLHVKEVERIASVLIGGPLENEQVQAWEVVVVAANGDVTTFSPEFMELRSTPHNHFVFGNILDDDFDDLVASKLVTTTQAQIFRGVERCRSGCLYFSVCGGGAPANKMQENGSLESSETLFCRMSVQRSAEALRRLLQWKISQRQGEASVQQSCFPKAHMDA